MGAKLGFDTVTTLQLSRMAEALLEVLELGERAAHQVVGSAPRAVKMLSELGERPILVEVQAAGRALVLGEHCAIDVEETLLGRSRGENSGGGALCQGQVLDMVHDCSRIAESARPLPATGWHTTARPPDLDYAATGSSATIAVCGASERRRAGISAATTAPASTTAPPTVIAGVRPATKDAPEV
jgi:hypothetical protein